MSIIRLNSMWVTDIDVWSQIIRFYLQKAKKKRDMRENPYAQKVIRSEQENENLLCHIYRAITVTVDQFTEMWLKHRLCWEFWIFPSQWIEFDRVLDSVALKFTTSNAFEF